MEKNDVYENYRNIHTLITDRITHQIAREKRQDIQNAIITNADCRLRNVHRACICLQREI